MDFDKMRREMEYYESILKQDSDDYYQDNDDELWPIKPDTTWVVVNGVLRRAPARGNLSLTPIDDARDQFDDYMGLSDCGSLGFDAGFANELD